MDKATLMLDALKNIEGYRINSSFKIVLIDFHAAKVLSTSNFTLVDSINWNYAFVYMSVYISSIWKPGNLFILDSHCNLVNFVEFNDWKLILEKHSTESAPRGFPTHQFIFCDPSKDFLEKKYLLHGYESYIKELIFEKFIPLSKFKSLNENALDKKLLKIIHGYPLNYNAGSEVYSQSICNELSKHHKVSVFTREENPYRPDFEIRKQTENSNLDFYFVNNPQGKDGYRHQAMDSNFATLIAEIKPDIAHIGHLNHLSTGIVDELNKQNIPIVFTLHDFWLMCPRGQFLTRSIGKENNFQLCSSQQDQKCATDCYKVYFSGREENEQQDIEHWSAWTHQRMIETKAIINKVDAFIAPSNYLRNRFVNEFSVPENKIIYLDYGFPTEYLTQTEKSKDNTNFTFGYIGTLIPAKGVNQLIEAFSQIETPATLRIYGRQNGQSTDALKLLAATSKNKIEFAGEYINHNLANDVFQRSIVL
ncbi:MAG: glycosyltransferase [Bacteroidetes bacterium]|nr:glycosyltransferase [Bacteroidota bacterium]